MIEYSTYRALQDALSAKPPTPDAKQISTWQNTVLALSKFTATYLPTELAPFAAENNIDISQLYGPLDEFSEEIARVLTMHPHAGMSVAVDKLPTASPSVDTVLEVTAALIANFPTLLIPLPARFEYAHRTLGAKIREYTALLAADAIVPHHDMFQAPIKALRALAEDAQTAMNMSIQSQNEVHKEEELAIAKVREAVATLNSVELQARTDLAELASSKEAALKSIGDLDAKLQPIEANYANFAKAIEAKYQIEVTRKLWANRQSANRLAFAMSALALLILLVCLPVLAMYFHKPILISIGNMLTLLQPPGSNSAGAVAIGPMNGGDGKATAEYAIAALNRLVFIAFPLGLYVWLVRLIVRFNTRSLTLMDDATTRQALMDTFYRIATDNGATDKEREMMLQAIFRPLPGHQNESADFPNVIELVHKPVGPH
jgi:hypothetical protein